MNTIRSIGGVPLPAEPLSDGFNVSVFDIDSDASGRSSETGELLRYPIREGVHKISLKFRCKGSAARAILDMVSPQRFSVTFWDMDGWLTLPMYVGDRSRKLIHSTDGSEWYDLSFDLIEY